MNTIIKVTFKSTDKYQDAFIDALNYCLENKIDVDLVHEGKTIKLKYAKMVKHIKRLSK